MLCSHHINAIADRQAHFTAAREQLLAIEQNAPNFEKITPLLATYMLLRGRALQALPRFPTRRCWLCAVDKNTKFSSIAWIKAAVALQV